MSSSSFNALAQWLSEYSLAITFALTAGALGAEWVSRFRAGASATRNTWLNSWRTNALLFAAGFALSWAMSPWLSPLLSQLLSGRNGALSMFDWPLAVRIAIGFVLLDFVGFALHWCEHRFAFWWRLHQVHHSDPAMNASTHFRHHPLSVVVDILARLPLLWLLGIPAVSWVIYALVSTVLQLWQHAHIATPLGLERALSFALVTPRFHRVHHHPTRAIHDHNFGTVLPWWDRLFGTYDTRWQADATQNATVGLTGVTARQSASLIHNLLAPFTASAAATTAAVKPPHRTRTHR